MIEKYICQLDCECECENFLLLIAARKAEFVWIHRTALITYREKVEGVRKDISGWSKGLRKIAGIRIM